MPTLNAVRHLHAALASLAAQVVDHEAVLVDGGSEDETLSIAAAHGGVRVVSAPGTSIYEALNRGISETHAHAIVMLNSDDVLLPGALAAWRDALARAPQCGMARGRANFVGLDADGVAVPIARAQARAAGALTIERILRGPGFINSLCIRRAVFDRIGPFDTRYSLAADREWMLRAYRAGVEVVEIDRPVYRYLAHDGSKTMDRSRRNYALIRREHLDIAARNLAGADGKKPALARALRRWHAAETGMLAWHQTRARDTRALSRTLGQATRLDLWWPFILAGETARWLTAQQRG